MYFYVCEKNFFKGGSMRRLGICAFFVFLLVPFGAFAQDDDDDLFDMDLLEDLAEETRSQDCTPEKRLEILVCTLNADILLQQKIYLRSNTLRNRSLHDLPSFTWLCSDCFGELSTSIIPFYNHTSRMFFVNEQENINSYINLDGDDFIDAVTRIINGLEISNVELRQVLPLFAPIRLQERRAGGYFRLCSQLHDLSFQFSIPLYYLERNFFLSDREINAIKMAPLIREIATGSSDEAVRENFTRHLVNDRLGLGDTRLQFVWSPYEDERRLLRAGVLLTLPTAVDFKRGIYGMDFCKCTEIPPLTVEDITDPFCVDDPQAAVIDLSNKLIDYAFGVLDRLTATTTDTSLGNNGHVTVGPFFDYEFWCTDATSICVQGNAQYVAPANELRMFIKPVIPAEFEKCNVDCEDKKNSDPPPAEECLAFFNEKLIDAFFPTGRMARVSPGSIIHLNAAIKHARHGWDAKIGYDFYWQGREHITLPPREARQFKLCKAINDPIIQHKVFGSLYGSVPGWNDCLRLGFLGDVTFEGTGIGDDFTLAFNIEFIF